MAGSGLATWVFSSLLLGLRIAPVFALAPPFTLTRIPPLFRLLFALAMAGAIAGGLPGVGAGLDLSGGGLLTAALRELLLGTIFLMAFQVTFGALYLAGRTVDIQAGFGLAGLIDPTSQQQAPLVGSLYAFAGGAVFFAMGGQYDLLRVLSASLDVVPLGGVGPALSLPRLGAFISAVSLVSLGLAGGAILALFVTDLAIAMMSRTVPQMNVLMLGFQVKTLLLLAVLPLSFGLWGALLARLARITLEAIPRLL